MSLGDRLRYAVERHVVLQHDATQRAPELSPRDGCAEFCARYKLWLQRCFAHYAVAHRHADTQGEPTTSGNNTSSQQATPAQLQTAQPLSAHLLDEAESINASPRSLDVREFVFMTKDLRLIGPTLTLCDVAKTLTTVTSFVGVPHLDKLDLHDFTRALFYIIEAKTFDGLIPASQRVERYLTHTFFQNLKLFTDVEMPWDRSDAQAGLQ